MLIVDERSLINLKDIGTTSQIISETAFNGRFQGCDFGAIPVVVLFGDDYQLPSTADGAFQCVEPPSSRSQGAMSLKGRAALLACASKTIELKSMKRLQEQQRFDRKLIEDVRLQADLSKHQSDKLLSLSIEAFQDRHGMQARREMEDKAVHLFYTNEKRIRHNIRQLSRHCSREKPVAFIQSQNFNNITGKADSRHWGKDDDPPGTTLLSIGAVVAIQHRNFNPLWGLHNGACGKVIEMVFKKGDSPNDGHLPQYVVVDFPHYCGPPWDKSNPTHVPIPPIQRSCRKHCCTRKFIPLTLAWARTIHKFQGMSAGPVDKGKFPNMFEVIICDPGKREDERSALGLFYTALSRATTLGDENGDGSAIYFCGEDFTEERFRNIAKKKQTDEDYKRSELRRKWVNHLEANSLSRRDIPNKHGQRCLLNWMQSTRFSQSELEMRASKFCKTWLPPP